MIDYNDIKDLIIYYDPIFGEISVDFIVQALQHSLSKQKNFEDAIYNILKNDYKMNDENITTLFLLSSTSTTEMYLDMLTDKL